MPKQFFFFVFVKRVVGFYRRGDCGLSVCTLLGSCLEACSLSSRSFSLLCQPPSWTELSLDRCVSQVRPVLSVSSSLLACLHTLSWSRAQVSKLSRADLAELNNPVGLWLISGTGSTYSRPPLTAVSSEQQYYVVSQSSCAITLLGQHHLLLQLSPCLFLGRPTDQSALQSWCS